MEHKCPSVGKQLNCGPFLLMEYRKKLVPQTTTWTGHQGTMPGEKSQSQKVKGEKKIHEDLLTTINKKHTCFGKSKFIMLRYYEYIDSKKLLILLFMISAMK